MGRIETIRIRCAYPQHDAAKREIRRFFETSAGDTPHAIRLCVNSQAPTELLVLVERRGTGAAPATDALGVHLARALRDLGLVSHVIWTEVGGGETEGGRRHDENHVP